MKAKTKYLKATKVARIENLIFSGFNLSADFFTLTFSLQRVYNKMTKQ